MKETKQEVLQETKGVTPEKIKAWKKEHGKVYKTTIGKEEYYWRKLKRKEYVSLMSTAKADEDSNAHIYQRQELIVAATVLYPEDIQNLIENDAGLATNLADEVILKSGFDMPTTEEL